MRFVLLKNGLPIELSDEYPKGDNVVWAKRKKSGNGWISTRDLESYAEVETLSKYLTAMTGRTFLPTDAGSSTSPRYDVIEAPKVGDPVSYAFNGDYYPCGFITKITPTWQVTTDQGTKFIRRGNSGCWKRPGGTWSMVAGHIDRLSPEF